ncbi:hypothetical protein GCM10027415_36800 [Humibacter ginsengisoli]
MFVTGAVTALSVEPTVLSSPGAGVVPDGCEAPGCEAGGDEVVGVSADAE